MQNQFYRHNITPTPIFCTSNTIVQSFSSEGGGGVSPYFCNSLLCEKHILTKNWCLGKKKTFFGHYILFGPFLAIFIHFNSIWCKNPISALLGEIFAGSILWNFHKGKDEYCQFPQIFWQTKSARGWYLNLMEKNSAR